MRAVLLPFVLPFAYALEHGEARLFGVRDGQRLEFHWRIERGNDLPHGLFARRAMRQRFGGEGSPQGEFSPAHFAVAFAEFVFVERHG